jgi:hypothetical protein
VPSNLGARARLPAIALAAALLLAGCDALRGTPPPAKPGDFADLRLALVKRDIRAAEPVSGDAGCDDDSLAPTAIRFDASGAGVPVEAPARLRVYLFRDDAAYERRRADVDACAAAWASDPATFEFVDVRPFVLAGQGPWPTGFKDALRAALEEVDGD